MTKNNIEIGSHTLSHCNLLKYEKNENYETYLARIRREIFFYIMGFSLLMVTSMKSNRRAWQLNLRGNAKLIFHALQYLQKRKKPFNRRPLGCILSARL